MGTISGTSYVHRYAPVATQRGRRSKRSFTLCEQAPSSLVVYSSMAGARRMLAEASKVAKKVPIPWTSTLGGSLLVEVLE